METNETGASSKAPAPERSCETSPESSAPGPYTVAMIGASDSAAVAAGMALGDRCRGCGAPPVQVNRAMRRMARKGRLGLLAVEHEDGCPAIGQVTGVIFR